MGEFFAGYRFWMGIITTGSTVRQDVGPLAGCSWAAENIRPAKYHTIEGLGLMEVDSLLSSRFICDAEQRSSSGRREMRKGVLFKVE